jgi:hypothetical protein
VTKIKISKTGQSSKISWDEAGEGSVGEVEGMEEREVTEVRAELSLKGNVLQHQGGDTPVVTAAACHAHPAAERHVACPVIPQDGRRIG